MVMISRLARRWSRANIAQLIASPAVEWRYLNFNGWTSITSGTGGSNSQDAHTARVTTGNVDAATRGFRTAGSRSMMSAGQNSDVIDWDKAIILRARLAIGTASTNGKVRVTLGKSQSGAAGDPGGKAIGLRVDNLALKGLAHNGTSLDAPDLAVSVTAGKVFDVAIYSDGQGTVSFYVDTDGKGLVLKGTSTGGPTGLGTAGNDAVHFEAENGGDLVAVEAYAAVIKVGVFQS